MHGAVHSRCRRPVGRAPLRAACSVRCHLASRQLLSIISTTALVLSLVPRRGRCARAGARHAQSSLETGAKDVVGVRRQRAPLLRRGDMMNLTPIPEVDIGSTSRGADRRGACRVTRAPSCLRLLRCLPSTAAPAPLGWRRRRRSSDRAQAPLRVQAPIATNCPSLVLDVVLDLHLCRPTTGP